jgi:hypothetical protein
MIGRRAAVGLTLLCALFTCAFAAPGAQAVTKGTTAFTCKPEPNPNEKTKGFEEEHCTKSVTGLKVKWIHESIEQGKSTIFHATNEKTRNETKESTPSVLKSKIAGLEFEITCPKVTAHGKLTNELDPTGEHWIHGTEITIHYTECTVPKPAGQECKVAGKTLLIEKVTATTTEQGDNIRFSPEPIEGKENKVFINIELEGCKTKELNGEHLVQGSVRGQPNGATINFTHKTTTEEKTLTFGGQAAGLEGSITLWQADETPETGKTGNPLSVTTVETP